MTTANKEYIKNKNNEVISPIVSAESVFKDETPILEYFSNLFIPFMKKMQPLSSVKDYNKLISYGSGIYFIYCYDDRTITNSPVGTITGVSNHFWLLQMAGGPAFPSSHEGFDRNYCIQLAIKHLTGDIYIRLIRTSTANIDSDTVVMWGWKKLAYST